MTNSAPRIKAPFHNNPLELLHEIQEGGTPVQLSFFDGRAADHDLKTQVRAFRDDEALYFLFSGRYGTLRTAPGDTPAEPLSGKTHRLWEFSDVYEVFIGIDARKNGKYREFQVAPDSRRIDIAIDGSGPERKADFEWLSGFRAASLIHREERIWNALFQIPFKAFDRQPEGQEQWNCNFYRISGTEPDVNYLAWAPVHRIAFHQPHLFGVLEYL